MDDVVGVGSPLGKISSTGLSGALPFTAHLHAVVYDLRLSNGSVNQAALDRLQSNGVIQGRRFAQEFHFNP